MSIAIHHGPPGSYKTFAIIQRHIIDALKAGRVVITNIRGLEYQKVIDAYPDIEFPDTADIITLPQKDPDALELIRRWWHWAPFGAMVVIDEGQMVYPMRRDFSIKSLDTIQPSLLKLISFPVELDFNGESRPANMAVAFDMHRHFNWDLFLSTPNIGKIHKEIRQSSEWAYRHRDLSTLLPWLKGKWVEVQHDAEFSGKSVSHVTGSPTRYKADTRTWQCYESTATGQHSESTAGRSIFSDPKILGLLAVIVVCICVFVSTVGNMSFVKPANASASNPVYALSAQKSAVKDSVVSTGTVNNVQPGQVAAIDFSQFNFGISADKISALPSNCSVTRHSVRCPVDRVAGLLNTYCLAGDSRCYVLIPIRT